MVGEPGVMLLGSGDAVAGSVLDPAPPSGHDGRGLEHQHPEVHKCSLAVADPFRQRHAEGTEKGIEAFDQQKGTLGYLAFQADCAGSIPVTRSTAVSRDTVHVSRDTVSVRRIAVPP